MITSLEVEQFIDAQGVIIDVRSPSEYAHAHIPGAFSVPLFSDEERAAIGTTYKQRSQRHAIDLGLSLAGPKLYHLVDAIRQHIGDSIAKIHCWRGGMRSTFVSNLLSSIKINNVLLSGGYKAFRNWAIDTIAEERNIRIVGGLTGCGKTDILVAMARAGGNVLDLEALANHRGSSFGNIGLPAQPSTEMFENMLAINLHKSDRTKPLWVEDESRTIGSCKIPDPFYDMMRAATVYKIEKPLDIRLQNIEKEYGKLPVEQLVAATKRLEKRLGGDRTNATVAFFNDGKFIEATTILLEYYDKTYSFGLGRRISTIHTMPYTGNAPEQYASMLVSQP